ncbi:MAG TPA: hypothetical protein VFJ98_03765, partial [Mycobacteriales bacterium]|nr:hypothetical protein [Mycobacteriales bacterium]
MLGPTATRRGLVPALALAAVAAMLAGPFAGSAAAAPKPRTPAPTITSGPPSPTSSRTATFVFEDAAANVKYTCSLDNGASTTCTSPKTYTGVANGSHVFRVSAKQAKRRPSNVTSYAWTVDTGAPPAVTFT